ncbi:uncharacterized protein LOC111307857 isoform X2 [Durio zibethinus]|uniref:Uncharacterized protein LOC111307857 isoform X2 n=1 Tax=Durio zibethinus TaxID=66656 RepID=A0A6P6AAN8_DURZI|nr:uncharacterized protein LOC111307857 isoform X2 [Durio zibethinus]
MAGVSLKCGDCGALLKSVEEAQEHAELTSHSNFSESTEAVLNLVCSACGKPCRSKTESDLHTKRTGHTEFVDRTLEAAKPISLEVPNVAKGTEEVVGEGSTCQSEDSAATTRFGEVTTGQTTAELQNIQAAYRLNGKNYLKWSQLVQTFLKGKGKLSHLLGTGPEKGDQKFEAWDEEDSMVMSWLWNSMTPDISDTCMLLSTAKDIWESIRQTYSKVKDAAQVYEVKIKTAALKQGNKSVTEYAILLKNLWQEMDHYRCIEMKCSEDATTLKKFIEKDRVYDFLAGLNVEFDQVRVQILGKQDLPSLNEVISMVRAEESRRGVMLDSVHVEGSAMVSNGGKNQSLEQLPISENGKGDSAKTSNHDNLWCTYCKKPRHTRDRCWKLHGKPSTSSKEWGYKGGQPRNQRQAHTTAMELNQEKFQEQGELDKKEIEKLRSLLGTLEKATGVCSLAHSSKDSGAGKVSNSHGLNVSDKCIKSSWVIDSGATDHMTHSSQKFSTYTLCPGTKKITVADGSLTIVARLGDVQINPSFILKNVFHVPRLSTNLISIQRLTRDMNCNVTFYPSYCEF